MRVSEIVTRVRAVIDELMANDSGFLRETADETNLTDVIADKIGYALQHVIGNAPIEMVGSDLYEELTDEELAEDFAIDPDSLVGRLRLPSDLLRVVSARLTSWSQCPVPESDASEVYLMQQDSYARGSWDRPVSILTAGWLEMYCARAATDGLVFSFIRKPGSVSASAEDPDPDVAVPLKLEGAFIYQVAGLAMTAFREDIAGDLFAIAARQMGGE